MGRKSKLTPEQWIQLEKRLNYGESASALAREFGVSVGLISQRFSKITKEVKKTAEMIAASQTALAVLPVAQQYQAISLAEKLRNISNSLAHAAENGAATAHRLSAIANLQVQKIDEEEPMNSQEQLQAISALTKIANDAASLGLGLVNANKGAAPESEKPKTRIDPKKLSTAALKELIAAKNG